MARFDVLIVTAVPDEYAAVLEVGVGDGEAGWTTREGSTGLTVAFRDFSVAGGALTIAVTQALGMGGANAVIASAELIKQHDVRCLAMCGVCAGKRGDVALGDVIIADRMWQYGAGKRRAATVDGRRVVHEQEDIETYRLAPPAWKHAAERFKVGDAAWLALRPRSYEAQGDWLLERVLRGADPVADAARAKLCADFDKAIERLWKRDLLADGTLTLTEKGRSHIERLLLLHTNALPEAKPLAVHVGPIASGSQVMQDDEIFARLSDAVRKVIGVEMEAAAIGALAEAQRVPHSVVMKAVMDHADADKSDNFKKFAARASAECLIAFLRANLSPLASVDGTARGPLQANRRRATISPNRGAGSDPKTAMMPRARWGSSSSGSALGNKRSRRPGRRPRGSVTASWRSGGSSAKAAASEGERWAGFAPGDIGGGVRGVEAHDPESKRVVAIKVLHPNLAEDVVRRERFFRGAREMATLDHAAIVKVLVRSEEDEGFHFFVMEHIGGGDFSMPCSGADPRDGVPIGWGGDALAFAHGRGLVHRDVKPANILLGADGEPKLTDFDLVGGGADSTGGTRTGAMGSFVYAAPEMLEHPQDADARADVFGLAMTTVFVIHGGKLPMKAFQHPGPFVDGLACDVRTKEVLKRALDWDPDKRFKDAGELCAALREVVVEPPSSAASAVKPPPPPVAVSSWVEGEDKVGRHAAFGVGKVVQRMRWIPPGRFLMGSPKDEADRRDDEDQHKVVLTSGYWLAETPCTQELWEAVMGENPSRFKGPNRPVEQVSWEDCQRFLAKLNDKLPGLDARLPTEAEWEHACRAGTTGHAGPRT